MAFYLFQNMQKTAQIVCFIFVLLIFFSGKVFSQSKIQILDALDKKPVPYANVWIKDGNWGTSSDIQGFFVLPQNFNAADSLVISVVGYQKRVINVFSPPEIILLEPLNFEISEIDVVAKDRRKLCWHGHFKRNSINLWYAGGAKPQMFAAYFPFDSVFKDFPFLIGLETLFLSEISDVKINVRLMKPDSAGFPGDLLHHQPLVIHVKKGKHVVYLDLSNQAAIFPAQGLFVAFEWIVIPENCYNMEYEDKNTHEQKTVPFYQPEIGVVPKETSDYSFIYIGGSWRKMWMHKSQSLEKYANKYAFPAIRLRLSN